MGIHTRLAGHGWNQVAVVTTVVAVLGVVVAVGAWVFPRSAAGNGNGSGPSTPSVSGSPAPDPSSSTGVNDRYLADISPDAGGGNLTAAQPHGFLTNCASGQSNDRSREFVWNLAGSYSSVTGEVRVAGEIDQDARVQVQWFVNGIQKFNNSQLHKGGTAGYSAAINGHELRLRVTCATPGGTVTFTNVTLRR